MRTGELPALWMVLCLVKGREMELGGQTHFQDGRRGQVGSGPPPFKPLPHITAGGGVINR